MSDIHPSAPDSAYLLNRPFTMPTEDGGVWAIAFSSRTGNLLIAVFAVVLLVMFALLWTFICFLAVLLGGNWATGEVTQTRYKAMVTLWNSDDSLLAFKRMIRFSYHSLWPEFKPAKPEQPPPPPGTTTGDQQGDDESDTESETDPHKLARNWGDFTYGILVAVVAISIYVGSIVVGIIGPTLIQIGNVAPVRPSTVFYPRYPTTPEENLQNFGLLAPAALRAIGSVESSNDAIRSKVKISVSPIDPPAPDGIRQQLDYNYELSGVDLGLQHLSPLQLSITGSCYTEYNWYVQTANETEFYVLYPELGDDTTLSQRTVRVSHNLIDIKNAPRAAIISHPNAAEQLARSSNVSFSVIVSSAHRASISKSSDPWYTTETRPTDDPSLEPAPYNATEWMKLRRPVLSCYQHDLWTYDSSPPASSVLDLDRLPGIDLPDAIHSVFMNAFSVPMVVTLGNAIGDSALRSRTTSPRGVIDAEKSSIKSDMERLVMAAYIASVNVFSGTVSFTPGAGGYPNVLEGDDGQPAPGAGDIVVTSSDVQTFSMVGLISLAAILVFLLIQAWLISWLVHEHSRHAVQLRNAKEKSKKKKRTSGASTTTTTDGVPASDEKKKKQKTKKSVWERFSALEAPRLFNDAFEAGRDERKCEERTVGRTVSFFRCGAHNCPGHAAVSTGCEEKTRPITGGGGDDGGDAGGGDPPRTDGDRDLEKGVVVGATQVPPVAIPIDGK